MEREYIYDAFISYRHTKLDKAVADKLQRQLERYMPPSAAMKDNAVKKLRIFRDETELPTSSNLNDDIRTALEKSRFLIVLCSKTTAQSKWCMQEITYFKELHEGRVDKIITLLTEGEPSEVFPPELCTEIRTITNADGSTHTETVDVEPLAANVSAPTESESLRKLNKEFLRVAAPLFGCGFDTLYNRNQRRFVRRVVAVSAALILFLVAFGIYSSIMIVQISTQRNELELRNRDLLIQDSRYLSKESAELLETGDRIGAINAALSALSSEGSERPWTPQAEYALSQALYAYKSGDVQIDRSLVHYSPVEQVIYSFDGTRVISNDRENNLYIWNPISGERIGFFSANADFRMSAMALSRYNRLYVSAGSRFVCIDANTTEIIWEKEYREYKPDTYGAFYTAFGDNSIVLSNGENTLAFIGSNGVLFVNAADGEYMFYKELREYDDTFFDNNGTFSTDDEVFYISSSDLSVFNNNEPKAGKISSINMKTEEVSEREFDIGSRVFGIYADEDMEIFAVTGYGGDGRDILLAFTREAEEPIWTHDLNTNAGFRSSTFIYRYESMMLVVCGTATVIVNAYNGERMIAETLPANILHCMALPQIPNRVVAVLETGDLLLAMLREDNLNPLFGLWYSYGLYRDVSAVSFIYYQTDEDKNIIESMRYAFVPKTPQRNSGQTYIALALYLEHDNYLSITDDGLAYHLSFSENGEYVAWISSGDDEGDNLYIANAKTGEVIYERINEIDINQLAFYSNNNIVAFADTWVKIIDWRNDAVVFEFDPNMYVEIDDSYPPYWNAEIAGNFALYSAGYGYDCFLVDIEKMAYQKIAFDNELPLNSNNHILNGKGELAVYSHDSWADDSGKIFIVTPGDTILLEDDLIKRDHSVNIVWSDDGSLLAAVNNRNEAVVYDTKTREKLTVIPLISPVGITFTPDGNYLLALGANGILYEHNLMDINKVRELMVYDQVFGTMSNNRLGLGMFAFLHWDGRDNIIITADTFGTSYVIDMEEFVFRAAIPNLGAYNEKSMIFAQYDSGLRIRNFYAADDLVNMAKQVLAHG